MHLIIGLGNPGARYTWTRHNIGFMVLDQIAEECGVVFQHHKAGCLVGLCSIEDKNCMLIKPETFMNNSGEVVVALCKESRASPASLVVIHDDLDLDLGRLKIQYGGSDGGHRGVKSIMWQLMDDQFTRVRIGVGRPTYPMTSTDYVLSPIGEHDKWTFEKMAQCATSAVRCIVCDGRIRAMNRFNNKQKPESTMTQ